MTQRSRLNSGRVQVTAPNAVSPSRYQFLGLDSAEPSLGISGNGNVLTTDINGSRIWSNQLNVANLNLSSTLNSTSTTGALVVAGGGSFGKDLWVTGNIYAGNVVGIQANVLMTQAPLLYLEPINMYPYNYDIGFYSHFIGGTANIYQHTGFVRDNGTSSWYLFSNVPEPIGTQVDVFNANVVYDNLVVGGIIGGNVRQTTSSTAPSNPYVGDQWYDTGTDILFQFEYDGTNKVWVDITSPVAVTNTSSILTGQSLSVIGSGSVGGTFTATNNITVNAANNPVAVVNGGTSGVGNIGALGATFNTAYIKSTSAQYADLAEKYTTDQDYAPGTVLVFGGSAEVTQSTTSHDTAVAGVVSTNPAHLMNDTAIGIAVALTGRVPCRVQGPINKGDLVVTSSVPGVAQRLDETLWRPGCVIGKSLEQINYDSIVTIEVVVGRI